VEGGRGRLRTTAGGEGGGHDGARRGADEVVAVAQVPGGLGLEAREARAKPGLAEHSAAAEHEHAGRFRERYVWHVAPDDADYAPPMRRPAGYLLL
jgi:hypothetical protein